MTKKIQDNYSFKKMDSTIKGLKTLSSIYKIASKVGLKNSTMDEAFNKLVEIEKQSIQIKQHENLFGTF